MLFRGRHEPTLRRGGNVVHRYANSSRFKSGADSSFLLQDDTDDNAKHRTRRLRVLIRKASPVSKRLVLFVCFITLAIKWMRDCRFYLLFHREASPRSNEFRLHPTLVQVPDAIHSLTNVTRLSLEKDPPHLVKDRKNRHWIHGKTKVYLPAAVIPENCEAEEWMFDLHPSCLEVHEIDLGDFFFNKERTSVIVDGKKRRKKVSFIGEGGFRTVTMFHDGASRRVIKTLNYEDNRNFDPRNYDRMRRDAVVSEQLTASPYTADLYSFCGMSSVVEYSNSDNMDWMFSQSKKPTKDELLQIAVDVARAVADTSHVNPETGRASVVHMDLKADQWIKFDNRWILNDFNLARFLTWDPVKQENCNVASGYSGGRYQAPEQFLEDSPRTEFLDVFSLGNILGFLLTQDEPFPTFSTDTVEEMVANGTIWRIEDPAILNSTHPFDIHVRKAMEMCLVFDPKKRPRAREVADFLEAKLMEYDASKD